MAKWNLISKPKHSGTTVATKVDKWDLRYMDLAKTVGQWSKDPSTRVGCVVVNTTGQVLSMGYNGFPRGIEDLEGRLNNRETKYRYVVHAEANAIYNATYNGVSLQGAIMYVSGLPCCSECAKGIIQVGIKTVIMDKTDKDNPRWVDSVAGMTSMFDEARIEWHFI